MFLAKGNESCRRDMFRERKFVWEKRIFLCSVAEPEPEPQGAATFLLLEPKPESIENV
jgi:hypothetical protein